MPGAIDDPADRTIETVREVRRAVGDQVDILVDVNGAYSPHHAIEIGKRLEDYGVFHFEEPVPCYDLPGLAQIADALAIPIAAGEMQFNRWQFRDLILQGRVDILQPDVVKAGGLSECQKIAALASAFNKPISTHNTQPTVCTAATLHFCAVHDHASYAQEYNIEPVPIRDGRHPAFLRGARPRFVCPGIQYRARADPGRVADFSHSDRGGGRLYCRP